MVALHRFYCKCTFAHTLIHSVLTFLQAALIQGDIAKAVPLIIFGGAAMIAAVLSSFLPETLNRKLPDTVDEAERFDR